MKKTTATTATANKSKSTSKKSTEVERLNLSKFADRLKDVEVKEKKEKETIYIYPEGFSKSDIGDAKGKKHRNKLRNLRNRICNNILVFTKGNRIEELKKEIQTFFKFYKENYLKNDLSIESISRANEEKQKDLVLMLDIIKDNQK